MIPDRHRASWRARRKGGREAARSATRGYDEQAERDAVERKAFDA